MLIDQLPAPSFAPGEHGFSLIELLVAMLSSTVVAGALFAVLNFSTTVSATISDKVQADQLGRTAMTRITDELHSACLEPSYKPIQKGSTETNLRFINAYSEQPEIKEAEVHEIVWSKATSQLIDYHAKNNGGTSPSEFTFPEPIKEAKPQFTVLASNVTPIVVEGKEVPIFQYFKYAEETTESETAAVSTLSTTPLSGAKAGLTAGEAGEAASVLISFNAAAPSGKTTRNRSTNFTNQVTFAFSVPDSETPIHDSPCQ
jgi:hypothetical protein